MLNHVKFPIWAYYILSTLNIDIFVFDQYVLQFTKTWSSQILIRKR
jgi:hypothetical protein